MQNEVVCKYSSLIDAFVKIRRFGDGEIRELLSMRETPTRRAYQQLVISACVLDCMEAISRKAASENSLDATDRIEEHFFALAVEVNPKLDLTSVTIPIQDDPPGGDLHLLPAEQEGASDCRFHHLAQVARNLEPEIQKRVIGQNEAISSVSKAIQKAVVGLRDPSRPIGTFLFVGQTGVGKTELAKALTECLFEDPESLVRVDCSEYSLPHEYAKLIGAPPGYIGYTEGGLLTDRAGKGDPCILLFDEVEKAHSKVHNLLLQILDEGWVTDSKGNRVSFQQAMIILTSNVGVERLSQYRNLMGFDSGSRKPMNAAATREATLTSLREEFRPEFINRLDEIVVFNPLTRADCMKITGNLLDQIADRAEKRRISLVFTRRTRDFVVRQGFSSEYGARELKRTLRELVENPLTEQILEGRIPEGSRVCVDYRNHGIVFHQGRKRA